MQRQVIITKDGSSTVHIPGMDVTYHSHHGAIQESQHVFIQAGLIHSGIFDYIGVHQVLEIGFGTGLNALLTLIEADKHKNRIYYTAIEPFPLTQNEAGQLNYCEQLRLPEYQPRFARMHECGWNEMYEISEFFRLTKINSKLADYVADDLFSVIYFDAFAPAAQPELWTKEVFEKMYALLLPGGILVTYCSKGDVRRAMQAAGFAVEKIPGPPGKREMVRAVKKG
ncbi:MAG TPA: tRNA (5-methylaminomethyl-2-thiouridine)(34)-methyltransferase MnmD [Chitinophagaceae bacterium]|nr:tRNA (5-methylaminomethyl-2-thiouridine)(34)-methyltransferase MnmD [Chitinophagaceae bacterium]